MNKIGLDKLNFNKISYLTIGFTMSLVGLKSTQNIKYMFYEKTYKYYIRLFGSLMIFTSAPLFVLSAFDKKYEDIGLTVLFSGLSGIILPDLLK